MTDQVLDLDLELDPIQRQVRDRYAEAAIAASTSSSQSEAAGKSAALAGCCDDGCCSDSTSATLGVGLYDAAAPRGLPDAALLASLGCGNPVAVAELREGETVLDLGSGGGIDVLLSAGASAPRAEAIGVDMTDEMLELARRNAAEAGAATSSSARARSRPSRSTTRASTSSSATASSTWPPTSPPSSARSPESSARRPDGRERRRRRRPPDPGATRRARLVRRLHRRRAVVPGVPPGLQGVGLTDVEVVPTHRVDRGHALGDRASDQAGVKEVSSMTSCDCDAVRTVRDAADLRYPPPRVAGPSVRSQWPRRPAAPLPEPRVPDPRGRLLGESARSSASRRSRRCRRSRSSRSSWGPASASSSSSHGRAASGSRRARGRTQLGALGTPEPRARLRAQSHRPGRDHGQRRPVLLWALEPILILALAAIVLRERVGATILAPGRSRSSASGSWSLEPAAGGSAAGIVLTDRGCRRLRRVYRCGAALAPRARRTRRSGSSPASSSTRWASPSSW